ncbi:anthranilate synthase component II [Falsibacillus albus]|uniref:Aminodeoxychorismate/anthranilate synthase component II n=1 Tax=Falsibacillus albus TaxID=2478915 RepID=A0A3L7JWX3_9BACI|nr:aminodeoxychorismate/anthranilate synthase component II [Falsibacillus albus]RLQ95368.1 aminodeoxychorismate/anthranilate synthase component II [Falsibacillus albus]
MILLIDNYDSFTYNLYQYISELGGDVLVKRNDEIDAKQIETLDPDAIILSPGPGDPAHAGNCLEVVKSFYDKTPILGICLGHQVIGESFGAKIIKASVPKHGKTSNIKHSGLDLFEYLPQPIEVMRYHSLIIDPDTLPSSLKVSGTSMDDGVIMGIKHQLYPVFGLQFHPESIGTGAGKKLIENFLNHVEKGSSNHENTLTKIS